MTLYNLKNEVADLALPLGFSENVVSKLKRDGCNLCGIIAEFRNEDGEMTDELLLLLAQSEQLQTKIQVAKVAGKFLWVKDLTRTMLCAEDQDDFVVAELVRGKHTCPNFLDTKAKTSKSDIVISMIAGSRNVSPYTLIYIHKHRCEYWATARNLAGNPGAPRGIVEGFAKSSNESIQRAAKRNLGQRQ